MDQSRQRMNLTRRAGQPWILIERTFSQKNKSHPTVKMDENQSRAERNTRDREIGYYYTIRPSLRTCIQTTVLPSPFVSASFLSPSPSRLSKLKITKQNISHELTKDEVPKRVSKRTICSFEEELTREWCPPKRPQNDLSNDNDFIRANAVEESRPYSNFILRRN